MCLLRRQAIWHSFHRGTRSNTPNRAAYSDPSLRRHRCLRSLLAREPFSSHPLLGTQSRHDMKKARSRMRGRAVFSQGRNRTPANGRSRLRAAFSPSARGRDRLAMARSLREWEADSRERGNASPAPAQWKARAPRATVRPWASEGMVYVGENGGRDHQKSRYVNNGQKAKSERNRENMHGGERSDCAARKAQHEQYESPQTVLSSEIGNFLGFRHGGKPEHSEQETSDQQVTMEVKASKVGKSAAVSNRCRAGNGTAILLGHRNPPCDCD